jgi:hypothetical protein
MQTAADALTATTRSGLTAAAALAHAANAQACYSLPAGTYPSNALAATALLSGPTGSSINQPRSGSRVSVCAEANELRCLQHIGTRTQTVDVNQLLARLHNRGSITVTC